MTFYQIKQAEGNVNFHIQDEEGNNVVMVSETKEGAFAQGQVIGGRKEFKTLKEAVSEVMDMLDIDETIYMNEQILVEDYDGEFDVLYQAIKVTRDEAKFVEEFKKTYSRKPSDSQLVKLVGNFPIERIEGTEC